ncbi:cysteine proteinase [Neolentinus lepideus HHB14362 ss-1]|uniref:Ubiquitin carboxyl-terminal hydrolase n=1 Tax=Neolentinus lepideus HHB14362 ss-1 TaxID=1314782 RepID=A0A165MSG6_9AGAM|nr:cysteine proteinase [Neolentinus lepideus HHB14362 ss-1]
MSDEESGWHLTESDPGVFTELLKSLGVPYIVDDLYSLDPDSLAALQPIRALVFLFKWLPQSDTEPDPSLSSGSGAQYDPDFPGFFAHQVVNNACATLAVMNALGNIPSLPSGPQLQELFSFTTGMDAQTRGLVITSSDWLREAHNALSPPSAISLDGLGLPKTSEDAYHFIVYMPAMGCVYEFDGLKSHPIRHGVYEEKGEGWIAKAREVVEARIATYPQGSLEFSLLALREDPLPIIQSRLKQLQDAGRGNDSEAAELFVRLSNENSKRERWAFENSVRRHNHLGFIHALLVAMAKAGKLQPAAEGARTKMQERIARRKEVGMDLDE